MSLTPIRKTFTYGAHEVTLETGEMARQAHGAVVVNMDGTVVLCTVVGATQSKSGQDFLPLTCDYIEKTYAAGKIPGGFFKREGRPSEKETLTSRLIDRPIRPLFPESFYNEVQVVAQVMSCNPEVDPDIAAMIGVSAALTLSGIPFKGPIGAARVGYVNGQYVLNPTATQLKESQLNLVVAGTEHAVLMVESEANELPEDVMLGSVVFGHEQMRAAIQAIHELADQAAKPAWDWKPKEKDQTLVSRIKELAEADLRKAFGLRQTQALVVATLGTGRDEQIIDALMGEYKERFMLHYNMPPYATGETGRMGSPKRREIGHGRLAKRALVAVLPAAEEFAYSMRVVSEITESNGSSSMASVCGGSLALMDAGVPMKAHVAGIAMGLIKEGKRFSVLTDILGDEDHLGDMDFKVAGTERGVTALQMDIKIEGITKEIMQVALAQAREGRMHILGIMKEALEGSRAEISSFAPRIIKIKINPEKIRDVSGKGGVVIRGLQEETGTTIEISDDGTISIDCVNDDGGLDAKKRIEDITADVEVGRVYDGTVLKLLDFGAIVQLLPGKDGLLHISQISQERVNNVSDYLKEGQRVKVKVLAADEKGRVRLSMKAVKEAAAAQS